jgi:SAM-dependent methyltransferase
MSQPSISTVKAYYDERIEGKIRDFTHANPRIEKAFAELRNWLPENVGKILEIGCGVGATSWRVACMNPDCTVLGVDVSARSIEVAQTCFREPNLAYRELLLEKGALGDRFDYVIMMDVYEHIAAENRRTLHEALAEVLSSKGRIFLSFPTPRHLQWLRSHHPDQIQPIDEAITPEILSGLANDLEGRLLFYREVSIWRTGDYAHAVVGRDQGIDVLSAPAPGVSIPFFGWVGRLIDRGKANVAARVSSRRRAARVRPWYAARSYKAAYLGDQSSRKC